MIDLRHVLDTFDRTFIEYPFLDKMTKELALHFEHGRPSRGAEGFALMGETGSGKSQIIKHFLRSTADKDHDWQDRGDVQVRPRMIVYIEINPNSTTKGVLSTLLEELGDPSPYAGTQPEMEIRVKRLLKALEVKLVIFDEAQHLIEVQGSHHIVVRNAANIVKGFLDSGPAVVLCGMPSIEEIFLHDTYQLHRRSPTRATCLPFDFKTKQDRRDFRDIIREFERNLPLPTPSNMATGEMAARFHAATSGYIGFVTRLIRAAIKRAAVNGLDTITIDALAEAYDLGAAPEEKARNPFRVPLDQLPNARLWMPSRDTGMRGSGQEKVHANDYIGAV